MTVRRVMFTPRRYSLWHANCNPHGKVEGGETDHVLAIKNKRHTGINETRTAPPHLARIAAAGSRSNLQTQPLLRHQLGSAIAGEKIHRG